jgi:hypothetical protein
MKILYAIVLAVVCWAPPICAQTFGSVTYAPGFNGTSWATDVNFVNPWNAPIEIDLYLDGNVSSSGHLKLEPYESGTVVNVIGAIGLTGTYLARVETSYPIPVWLRTYNTAQSGAQYGAALPALSPVKEPRAFVFNGSWPRSRKVLYTFGVPGSVELRDAAGNTMEYVPFWKFTAGVLNRVVLSPDAVAVIVSAPSLAGPGVAGPDDPPPFYAYITQTDADTGSTVVVE